MTFFVFGSDFFFFFFNFLGFHLHIRSMYDCVYMNPRYLNILMHEFMSRWNTKARIRNLGYAGFGTFQLELLDRLDILVSSYLGSWIPLHPLRLGDVVYKRLPANSNPKQTFGMTPLFEATAATVRKALSSGSADGAVVILAGDEDGDGNVQGGVILGASDAVLPDPGLSLENEDDAEAEHHDTSMQNEDPVPLTTPDELNLFLQLHAAMIHPNNTTDKALPVDFILLTEQFNMEVVKRRTADPSLASVLKLKTPSLIHKAYDMAAESFRATEVVGPKLETLKELRRMLNSNTGFVFPEIKPRDNPPPAVQFLELLLQICLLFNHILPNILPIPIHPSHSQHPSQSNLICQVREKKKE